MNQRLGMFFVSTLLFASTGSGQEPPEFDDSKNLGTYLSEYSTFVQSGQRLLVDRAVAGAARTSAAIPQSADPGGATAARDGNASFAPKFQLGIDSIEAGKEEGSFIVKWNQHELLNGSVSLSATIRQAAAAEEILNEVASTTRKALEGAIETGLTDLDDLTFSLRWGLEKAEGKWRVGRRFDLYDETLTKNLTDAIDAAEQETGGQLLDPALNMKLGDCEVRAVQALGGENWGHFTRSQLQGALPDFDECLKAAREREATIVRLDRALDPLHSLAFLVDNQPQLVVTGLVHSRNELAGRDGWEVEVNYEHGLCNLNAVLNGSGCGDKDVGLSANELRDLIGNGGKLAARAQAGHKFTISARYAERKRLQVNQVFGSGDDAIPLELDLPAAEEIAAKLQYSRNVTFHPVTVDGTQVFPKLHISAEYVDVSDDPKRRDRLVSQLTYEIPLTASATLPLSISYANHAEYLGEVDEELSAHIGLSYSIKTKKKENGGT